MAIYTESRITDDEARAYLATVKGTLEARKETRAPLQVFCDAINRNLTAKPSSYLRFGPYWWAVKLILNESGLDYGQFTEALSSSYCVKAADGTVDREATMIAGWMFWEYYNSTRIQGSRDFVLDEDGASYRLIDPDMELIK